MKRLVLIFVLTICSCYAGETRSFLGKWTPPPSLQEFWKPVDESWWKKGTTPKLDRYCRRFAAYTKPEKIIPDMIADLKSNPSEVRWFVYLDVMLNWSRQRVLHVLKPFYKSRDPEIAGIATDFWADIETPDQH